CIGFLQHPDNLLFTEPRFLHDKVSPAALPLTLQWDTSEGKGHTKSATHSRTIFRNLVGKSGA
ncbi:hypothetical protein, partial [Burkholderia contaminans]|uniref:hypothetical protein n=1 Tax=Burkholderia contaminans TaxID=488447 RepID=UPI002D7ED73E